MCLNNPKGFYPPKDFIVGYKIIVKRQNEWRSFLASQIWHFAELVSAKDGRDVNFRGYWTSSYDKGIHAYKRLRATLLRFKKFNDKNKRKRRIVKVLLFGVTHQDDNCYRSRHAIIIETLHSATGKRIPW